jgi:hypothetical protein
MLKPIPHGKEKSQLWARIRAEAPVLADTMNTFAEQFPGCKVKSFDFAGDTYYDPFDPPPKPDKVYELDESFLLRLPAAERQKFYDKVNPRTAFQKAVAAKKRKKK